MPLVSSSNCHRSLHRVWAPCLFQCEEVCRLALKRRYHLLPHIYTLFYMAHTMGTPVTTPTMFAGGMPLNYFISMVWLLKYFSVLLLGVIVYELLCRSKRSQVKNAWKLIYAGTTSSIYKVFILSLIHEVFGHCRTLYIFAIVFLYAFVFVAS